VWPAVRTVAAAAAPLLAAVLPAALLGTRPHAAAPCGTVDARAAVLAAGTPTTAQQVTPGYSISTHLRLHITSTRTYTTVITIFQVID